MSHIPRAIGVISSLISQFRILVAHPSGEKSGRWLSRAVKALRGLAFVTMQAILLTLITTSSQAQTIPPTTCSPTNYFQAPLGWQPSAPDPPPLNGSTLKYGFDHEGGPQWQTSDTSPTRSSRSFGRLRFCAAKAWRWRMPFARSAFP